MYKRTIGVVSAAAFLMSTSALAQTQTELGQTQPDGSAARPTAVVGRAELIDFRVDSGPLSRVFSQVLAQARASVSSSQDVGDTPVKGVSGRMTLSQALTLVFQGTPWLAETIPGGAIHLTRRNDGEDATNLDRVVVKGRRTDFARNDSSLLTRTDTPLRQTPATVDSVTEEVIRSQNAFSIAEALRNVPGVLLLNGTGTAIQVGDGDTNGVSYTGGLRNSSIGGNAPITDVESVEVLKGVASVLTGAQVAGGTVNYIPKRATGERRRDIAIGVGTGEEFLTTFDVGGPLAEERGLAFRVAGQVQTADERPNGSNNPYSHAINGMLGYRGAVDADLGLQYYTTKTALVDLASYDPTTGTFTPYGSRLNDGRQVTVESTRLSYSVERDLVNRYDLMVRLRTRGQFQHATSDGQFQSALAYDFFGLGSFIISSATRSVEDQSSHYADVYSEFSTGPVEHKAIIALDMTQSDLESQSSAPGIGFTMGQPFPLLTVDRSGPKTRVDENQYGVVVQDQMTMGRFHGLIGLRQSWYKNDTLASDGLTRTVVDERIFLPSFGLVYDVSDALSIYGSYREGFQPLSPLSYPTFDNSPLRPSLQSRKEVGFKSGLFEDRLTINGSYYWYSTENEAIQDFDHPGSQIYFKNGPGSTGKGFELSLAGSATPTLKILGGVTHQTQERRDGNEVFAQPEWIANAWAIKTFILTDNRSIDVGFGANYNTGVKAFDIPTTMLLDLNREFLAFRATVGYRSGDTRINLSIDNLFDRENYEPTGVLGAIPMAPPRVIRLVFSRAF
ncbi:Outer membrane receptor for ferric coprogen and ferric-rhodotorulic acid [Pseudoxanthomonas sp. CF125]|nr:Outer membrane receptor for ferric coprogen and ferric-rhodotorulic acid [Pseudoxanthomonas sp. CF125]